MIGDFYSHPAVQVRHQTEGTGLMIGMRHPGPEDPSGLLQRMKTRKAFFYKK